MHKRGPALEMTVARQSGRIIVADRRQRWAGERSGSDHVHAAAFAVELHDAIDQGEQGVVRAQPNAAAWMELGADLPHQDVAGDHLFSGVALHATSLPVGIAAVAARSLAFLMSHCSKSPKKPACARKPAGFDPLC